MKVETWSWHMLLLPSRFSHVRLCAIPWTAAYQASLSMGFSRQEHWSGLPFPSPMYESEVTQSCLTLSDPMDCSPPGSIHGIFRATVLEWGAIAFSRSWHIEGIKYNIYFWTARRSNQSILKEVNSEYSLKGLMLKLKLQYFGHLMQRASS